MSSHSKKLVTETKEELTQLFDVMSKELEDKVNEEMARTLKNVESCSKSGVDSLAGAFGQYSKELNQIKEAAEKAVRQQAEDSVVVTHKIKLPNEDVKVIEGEHFHSLFDSTMKAVYARIPIMLVGPAGTGKNHTLEQVARTLNLPFYFSNAITNEFKLTGFIDANGHYQETQFYKAFKNGGLFMLDEMDASDASALVVINAAIANGYFDFPCGRVNAHEDFRICCAANTYGRGSDMVYTGRTNIDGSTLDRFIVYEFNYDPVLEKKLTGNDKIYEFTSLLRAIIEDNKIRHTVSMRASIMASKMLSMDMDISFILKAVYFKGLKTRELEVIKKELNSKSFDYTDNDWVQRAMIV